LAEDHLAGDLHGLDRLDLLQATLGFEVLVEQLVDGLRRSGRGEQPEHGDRDQVFPQHEWLLVGTSSGSEWPGVVATPALPRAARQRLPGAWAPRIRHPNGNGCERRLAAAAVRLEPVPTGAAFQRPSGPRFDQVRARRRAGELY